MVGAGVVCRYFTLLTDTTRSGDCNGHVVQDVLTHALVETKLFIRTIDVTVLRQLELIDLVLCCVLCTNGFGVDLACRVA